jgi:PAS domain S-box-containing protein
MLVVARDVRKRRLTEQAARESEDRYRSLFELCRDAIYCSARDGSVADVNDSAIDLFGYTRAEFLGLEARKLYKNSEDIRAFQRTVEKNGTARDLPVEFLKKSGESFRGLLAATLRTDGDGNVQGYQCLISPVHPQAPTQEKSDAAESDGPAHVMNTVLVTGKDRWVLDDARSVLERAGIEVLSARTTAAAMEILRSHAATIGAVLMDLGPDDPEFQAAMAEIRQVRETIQAIVFVDERSQHGASPLADASVRKPLHPLALVQQVRESLEASRQSKAPS